MAMKERDAEQDDRKQDELDRNAGDRRSGEGTARESGRRRDQQGGSHGVSAEFHREAMPMSRR